MNLALALFCVAAFLADGYLTWEVLRHKKGVELNPAMNWLFKKIGLGATLIVTKVVGIGLVVATYYAESLTALLALAVIYTVIVVNNWGVFNAKL
jgi:hypothetical protein